MIVACCTLTHPFFKGVNTLEDFQRWQLKLPALANAEHDEQMVDIGVLQSDDSTSPSVLRVCSAESSSELGIQGHEDT